MPMEMPLAGKYYLLNQDQLRSAVDPECKWLTDGELDNILSLTGGYLKRAATKALLSIQSKAFVAKDAEAIRNVRGLLLLHENDQLFSVQDIRNRQQHLDLTMEKGKRS